MYKRLFMGAVTAAISIMIFHYILTSLNGDLSQANFDFKTANDVEQRLSDVKGIDEIKTEVENIIKVVQ